MKINVIDESERQQTLSYFKGFTTGVFSTLQSLVKLREGGAGLKILYKTILSNYKVYQKRYEDENNNK